MIDRDEISLQFEPSIACVCEGILHCHLIIFQSFLCTQLSSTRIGFHKGG